MDRQTPGIWKVSGSTPSFFSAFFFFFFKIFFYKSLKNIKLMLNPFLSHSKSDKIIIVGSNVDVWERVPNLNMSMDSSNKIEERAYGEGGGSS